MKVNDNILIFGSMVFTIGFMIFMMLYKPDVPLETAIKSTSLPLASNQWKKIDLEEGNNSDTTTVRLI